MTIEDLSKKACEIRKKKGLSQYNIWKQGMKLCMSICCFRLLPERTTFAHTVV